MIDVARAVADVAEYESGAAVASDVVQQFADSLGIQSPRRSPLPSVAWEGEVTANKSYVESIRKGTQTVLATVNSVELEIPIVTTWAGYAPQALNVRLGSGRRANALKSIVEGFRASSENNFGNRDANGQDWLRDLLDKVADVIEEIGK
jgi:hypothetical protein